MARWRAVGLGLLGGVIACRAVVRRRSPDAADAPGAIVPGRQAATVEAPVVVFLVGMRIHRFSALGSWLPAFRAMRRMRRELERHPELGLLHTEQYLAVQGAMLCQYWRSIEDLERFAHDGELPHLPAWREFNRRARDSNALGLWHEAYVVSPGGTEAIYVDMPPTGLGVAVGLAPAKGALLTAARRMGRAPTPADPAGEDAAVADGIPGPDATAG